MPNCLDDEPYLTKEYKVRRNSYILFLFYSMSAGCFLVEFYCYCPYSECERYYRGWLYFLQEGQCLLTPSTSCAKEHSDPVLLSRGEAAAKYQLSEVNGGSFWKAWVLSTCWCILLSLCCSWRMIYFTQTGQKNHQTKTLLYLLRFRYTCLQNTAIIVLFSWIFTDLTLYYFGCFSCSRSFHFADYRQLINTW